MFSEHKSDIKLIAKYSNLSNGIVKSDSLELSNTGADYIYSKDKTGDFRAFRYELPINDPCSLRRE